MLKSNVIVMSSKDKMQDISFVYGTERHRTESHHYHHPVVNVKVQSSKEGSGAVVSSTQFSYGDVDDVANHQPIQVELKINPTNIVANSNDF